MTISVNPADLPLERGELFESRSAELGEYTVDFGSGRAGLTMGLRTFAGLPERFLPVPVYGGDFFTQPRSEFDPDTLAEGPYRVERTLALFDAANEPLC